GIEEQIGEFRGVALCHPSRAGHHGGDAATDRLMDTEPVSLIKRWLNEKIGGPKKAGNILGEAHHAYAVAQAFFFRLGLPVGNFGAAAGSDQIDIPIWVSA